jgi:hypothetical protein
LAGPMLVLAGLGGLWELLVAVAAIGGGVALRAAPRGRAAGAACVPPLAGLVVIVVAVPPTLVEGILAAVAGLGLLLWLGSDGRTMASVTDRLGGLALPGFAAFLALATSLAARGVPPSFGIAVARPPFSDGLEITIVRPIVKLTLEDYNLSEKLMERLKSKAEGILIAGPPGSGKTMSAQAIAGELHLPLYLIRLEGMITRYMGETAAKLRLIFDETAKRRGVYLFDEFDAVAHKIQFHLQAFQPGIFAGLIIDRYDRRSPSFTGHCSQDQAGGWLRSGGLAFLSRRNRRARRSQQQDRTRQSP